MEKYSPQDCVSGNFGLTTFDDKTTFNTHQNWGSIIKEPSYSCTDDTNSSYTEWMPH